MTAAKEIPHNIIPLSDLAARRARDESLLEGVQQPLARSFVTNLLNRPVLRPLLELEINGCTNYEGALVLLGQELIQTTRFRCRSTDLRGAECEALEFSNLGWATLEVEQEGLENNLWMSFFREAIGSYACIDAGSGICMTRAHLETALEIPDPAILERVVFLNNGMRQFPNNYTQDQFIDDQVRRDHSSWWSLDGEKRNGVSVVDLAQKTSSSVGLEA